MQENTIRVWDPLVRIFHWSLVAAFFIAWISEDELQDIHVLAGYSVAGLVGFRLIWGVIGTRYARFGDFVYRPSTIIAYLKDILLFRAKRYIGHNPAGGAMVIALLLSLSATTLTGMQLYAVEEHAGPFADIRMERVSPISSAFADEHGDLYGGYEKGHDNGGAWEDVHEFFANFTLFLVMLHIAGVALGSFAHGENLPRAMLTGRKAKE